MFEVMVVYSGYCTHVNISQKSVNKLSSHCLSSSFEQVWNNLLTTCKKLDGNTLLEGCPNTSDTDLLQ